MIRSSFVSATYKRSNHLREGSKVRFNKNYFRYLKKNYTPEVYERTIKELHSHGYIEREYDADVWIIQWNYNDYGTIGKEYIEADCD